jgi:hypothetical protein
MKNYANILLKYIKMTENIITANEEKLILEQQLISLKQHCHHYEREVSRFRSDLDSYYICMGALGDLSADEENKLRIETRLNYIQNRYRNVPEDIETYLESEAIQLTKIRIEIKQIKQELGIIRRPKKDV